jgi:polyene glycosyltransferase
VADNSAKPILFASLPEAGLFNPLFVLAQELTRRGVQDVWFATDEPRRGDIEAISATFASLGEVIPELSALTYDDEVYREVTGPSRFKSHAAQIKHGYRPAQMFAKYRQLEAVVDKVRPALMVVDCETRFAIDLAIARRIPYVLSVPFLVSNVLTPYGPFAQSYVPHRFPTPHTGLPYDMNLFQAVSNRLFRVRTLALFFTPAVSKTMQEDIAIRKELGLGRPPGPMSRVAEAGLALCYSVAQLDYPLEVPGNVRLVGPMIPPLPQAQPGELAEWLDTRPSVIYVGLGTNTRLTTAEVSSLTEVARRMEGTHHLLWKLPQEQQHLLPPRESLPGNLRIESWVPSQLDVLAHQNVTAFVTHGGGNGFHEGLYFGKPMVVRPLWGDCYDVAVRGKDMGVSLTLDPPRTADPDHVASLLARVLNEPSFRQRAGEFAALERGAGGRETAADLILSLPAMLGPTALRSAPSPETRPGW